MDELRLLYAKHFSLGWLGNNISNKFALISLTCWLTYKLKEKNRKITYLDVLEKIGGEKIEKELLERLAIVCEEFGYGCTEFPTFNLPEKEIPKKIKELLEERLPF